MVALVLRTDAIGMVALGVILAVLFAPAAFMAAAGMIVAVLIGRGFIHGTPLPALMQAKSAAPASPR